MTGFTNHDTATAGIQNNVMGKWCRAYQLYPNSVGHHIGKGQPQLGIVVHVHPQPAHDRQGRIERLTTDIGINLNCPKTYNEIPCFMSQCGACRHQGDQSHRVFSLSSQLHIFPLSLALFCCGACIPLSLRLDIIERHKQPMGIALRQYGKRKQPQPPAPGAATTAGLNWSVSQRGRPQNRQRKPMHAYAYRQNEANGGSTVLERKSPNLTHSH